MFATGALEKWSVRQNIGGRLDLTEELLRREQIASFHEKCRGSGASIAPRAPPGKGTQFPAADGKNWVPIGRGRVPILAPCDAALPSSSACWRV